LEKQTVIDQICLRKTVALYCRIFPQTLFTYIVFRFPLPVA